MIAQDVGRVGSRRLLAGRSNECLAVLDVREATNAPSHPQSGATPLNTRDRFLVTFGTAAQRSTDEGKGHVQRLRRGDAADQNVRQQRAAVREGQWLGTTCRHDPNHFAARSSQMRSVLCSLPQSRSKLHARKPASTASPRDEKCSRNPSRATCPRAVRRSSSSAAWP